MTKREIYKALRGDVPVIVTKMYGVDFAFLKGVIYVSEEELKKLKKEIINFNRGKTDGRNN